MSGITRVQRSARSVLFCWFILIGFAQAPASAALLSDPQADKYNVRIGTQTFSPKYKISTDTKLVETASAIRSMGSDTVKFYMGKSFPGQYGINLPSSISDLKKMARDEPSCRQVLDMSFRHFMIWIYTFASNGNDTWWKDGYSANEKQMEYDEIYALSQHLLTNYNNSGKSFYFGHWEGDWYLLSNYDTTSNPSPTVIQGMIDWLNNRQKAVDDALRDTPHTNVFLFNYAEANRVRDAMLNGPSSNQRLVNMVLPNVTNIDYVSWSAYDGMELSTADLHATLDYIAANLPTNKASVISGKRIIIGEYGWGGTLSSAAQELPTRRFIQKAINWGAPFILFWQMYDNENLSYWLIDSSNAKTPCYFLHQWFINKARLLVAQFKEMNNRLPTDAEFVGRAGPMLDAALTAPTNLEVSNLGLASLSATNAIVSGKIAQGIYQSEQANVWVFWGKQDGGTVQANWEQETLLGVNTNFNPAVFSPALHGLIPRTNYYFRFYASNSLGEAWAPSSAQFNTDVLETNHFGGRMKISLSGYTRNESLTNFPLLVQLNTSLTNFHYRQFASRLGGDLRFTDATGAQPIAHEIDEWNTNGTSLVWVRVPILSSSNDFIWAYWGNPLSTNLPAYSTNGTVWSQNFELVWHLKETTFPFADSTLKHPGSIGSPLGMPPTGTSLGKIGRGSVFNGTSHHLWAGMVNMGERFTLSGWVKVDATANTIQTIWANKSGGSNPSGFALFANSYASRDQKLILETGNGSVAAYGDTPTNVVTLGQWKHVAATIDRAAGKATLYVDGVDKTVSTDIRSDMANNATLYLGAFTNSPVSSAFPFKGTMDEMRIETDVRSSNWLWASWMNVASNSSFLRYSNPMQQTPLLSFSASTGSGLLLEWPSSGIGFTLRTTTNLTPPVVWSALTNQAILTSNRWQVTLPTNAAVERFYQLRSP